ncbi:MAG: hypothetical protein KDA20_00560 [Phycisphaerales bacterium]|nr:hypothetical protein [Phycisphaerales bacterium]
MARTQFAKGVAAGAALVGFGFISTAFAGPFDPSYRGNANSVHAIFDWVGAPDGIWNNTVTNTAGTDYPLDPTPFLAGDDGLDMRILLPNFVDDLPQKLMRIQFIFNTPVPGDLISIAMQAYDPNPTTINIVGGSTGFATAHYIDVEIYPNPDSEEILVFGDPTSNIVPGNLYQIEIDTVSQLPTPGAFALLGMAGAASLRRRR